MKRSAAAWLLIGLSLGVPQFCKGEGDGARAARCGTGWSPLGNAAQGAGGGPRGAPGAVSAAGGTEEAMRPACLGKVLAKSERSAWG